MEGWALEGRLCVHGQTTAWVQAMDVITLEIDDDGCGRLQFELPADASDEEVAYIESLVPRIESGFLELRDPSTGDVMFSCRPSLTGESLLKTAIRSGVKLRH